MDLDGPVTLLCWPGGARPDKASVVGRDMLEHVLALPFGQGVDHPEGISLFSSQDGREEELLVVHDSASPGRQIGDSILVADVYPLPPRRRKK